MPTKISMELKKMDAFTKGYVEAALEYSNDKNGIPMFENHQLKDMDVEHFQEVKKDCLKFQQDNCALLQKAYQVEGYTEEMAGHDFWLTRNNHGVGYWDRGLGEAGIELSNKALELKNVELYVDDNKLYFTNLISYRKQMSFKF